jgi:hypothetical protein
MVVDCRQQTRRLLELCNPKLILPLKVYDSSEASGVTIIISDHYRGIKRLEIEHDERTVVEIRLGLHNERHALGSVLLSNLQELDED